MSQPKAHCQDRDTRPGPGSAKEYIGMDDYQVTIAGRYHWRKWCLSRSQAVAALHAMLKAPITIPGGICIPATIRHIFSLVVFWIFQFRPGARRVLKTKLYY
jgi:hypothetical protein